MEELGGDPDEVLKRFSKPRARGVYVQLIGSGLDRRRGRVWSAAPPWSPFSPPGASGAR